MFGLSHLSFPMIAGNRARRLFMAVALCTLGSGLLAPGRAAASGGGTPLAELTQAQSQTAALVPAATSPSVRQALTTAATELSDATAQSLWSDSNDLIAPPYGASVFEDSRVALGDLQSLLGALPNGSVTVADIRAIEALVVAANQGAAYAAIGLAAPANPPSLQAARGAAAAGDGAAGRGLYAQAVPLYETAWNLSYRALTGAVVATTTSLPFSSLAAGAQAALTAPGVQLFPPSPITNAPPLTSRGQPELFYVGIEACPFCAVERWALVLALSQFGHFSNLSLSESASFDGWTEGTSSTTKTFTFYGSNYSSPYISFVPVEWATNQPGDDPFGLSPLQPLTPDQAHLVDTYNPYCFAGGFEGGGLCGVPFVDVGNRYLGFAGITFSYLTGLTWWQIASGLSDPSLTATQALDGAATLLIAEICGATGDQPASVCNNPVVQQYKLVIGSSTSRSSTASSNDHARR